MSTKKCCKCKEEKSLVTFSKNQDWCKPCSKSWHAANKEKRKIYREANRAHISAVRKAWHEANRETQLKKMQAWKQANNEKVIAYRMSNLEKKVASNKSWRQSNPDKVNAITAKRRSRKLQASPKWMTKADFEAIREWYVLAKELQWLSEEPLQVDHIIPLQGKDVCGLHIASNLQILPASENIQKSNKMLQPMVKYVSADAIGAVKDGN